MKFFTAVRILSPEARNYMPDFFEIAVLASSFEQLSIAPYYVTRSLIAISDLLERMRS